ncbi:hypothetical protein [Planktotalea sp.]|uniref:hypothetical protein n=1 Tax=Planktotalea sp. TaxID=2029877 RepID=UPI003D6B5C49
MTERSDPKKQSNKQASREDRLKAALKANLGRRKAQAKTRSHAEQQQSPKGET